MASIHRDPRAPKGVWYAAYRLVDGRKAFRSTGTRDRGKAEIIAQAWDTAELAAAAGNLAHDRVLEILNETMKRLGATGIEFITVKDWLNDWLESKKGQVAESTHAAYTQAVTEFLACLGEHGSHRRLDAITEADIERYIRLMRDEGRSGATINKIIRKYLTAPFEKARKAGKIRFNPVMVTTAEPTENNEKDTFTAEQVAALVAVADPDWQGVILFGYGSGGRLGDIRNLKWSNLDVAAGIGTFREEKTKGRGARQAVIGLHPDFLDWLATRPAPEDGDAPVFPTLIGKPLNGENGLSNRFIGIMERAGVEGRLLREGNAGKGRTLKSLTFHSLRHNAATTVFNQAALKEITRRVTNHAAGGVVDRYIHDDVEAIKAAVGLIPRLPKVDGQQNERARF
jgi:integrase